MGPGPVGASQEATEFVLHHPLSAGTGRVFPDLPESIVSIIVLVFCGVGALLWVSSMIPLRRSLGLYGIRTPEGSRVFGFVIFAAGMAALILGLAWGRSQSLGTFSRYALLTVPGLCAVYFMWILYEPETTRNRVAIAFAIALLLALPFNVRDGLDERDWYVTNMRAFEQDLAKGLSWQELADRHQFLLPWDRDGLVKGMRMLHEAKIDPFGRGVPR